MITLEALARPHALSDEKQKRAYQTLVEEYASQLVSCIWMQDGSPVWDQRFDEERKERERTAYNRFRPLSTLRRRNCDDL